MIRVIAKEIIIVLQPTITIELSIDEIGGGVASWMVFVGSMLDVVGV